MTWFLGNGDAIAAIAYILKGSEPLKAASEGDPLNDALKTIADDPWPTHAVAMRVKEWSDAGLNSRASELFLSFALLCDAGAFVSWMAKLMPELEPDDLDTFAALDAALPTDVVFENEGEHVGPI